MFCWLAAAYQAARAAQLPAVESQRGAAAASESWGMRSLKGGALRLHEGGVALSPCLAPEARANNGVALHH